MRFAEGALRLTQAACLLQHFPQCIIIVADQQNLTYTYPRAEPFYHGVL